MVPEAAAAPRPISISDRYRQARRDTEDLVRPLSPEDCSAQSMPDASPVKWHLAHTSWFFETFLLEREIAGYESFHPDFRVLFNSYYHAVGDQHPRPERGMLTRPSLEEVLAYRAHVDSRMVELIDRRGDAPALAEAIELGLHHEQQHQELLLTDVKHLLSLNPLHPAYQDAPVEPLTSDKPLEWMAHEASTRFVGAEGAGFCFDNERPRHRVFVEAFQLASRPCTNAEYLAFIDDGGYERPELWLADGWLSVDTNGWSAPLYWENRGGEWETMTLSGLRTLRLDEPVCHVSYYEADAFARWMCARLPSEAEWESAAAEQSNEGNFVDSGRLHPAPPPSAASSETPGRRYGPVQLFGDVWEWTQSPYSPYPGFQPLGGDFGEYNGKFMCNQLVLRGGSCVTPRNHIRASYRNFFYPDARWQFSGLRLARDAE